MINPEFNLGRRRTLIHADKKQKSAFSAFISVQKRVYKETHPED
jgi:hypothetical protein